METAIPNPEQVLFILIYLFIRRFDTDLRSAQAGETAKLQAGKKTFRGAEIPPLPTLIERTPLCFSDASRPCDANYCP